MPLNIKNIFSSDLDPNRTDFWSTDKLDKLNYNFNLNVSKFINKEYMAEWSKALHSGCSPKGREFESLCTHNYYFFILCII